MMNKALKSCLWAVIVFLLVFAQEAWCADLKAGIKAYESGDYDQAIQLINEYLKQKPRDEKAYFHLGNCYFKKGEWDPAIEQYQKALELKAK